MSNCFSKFNKAFKEFLFLIITLTPTIAFSQVINITSTNTINYDVAGNSTDSSTGSATYGRINISSPWNSANFHDPSSNNSIIIHSRLSSSINAYSMPGIYGSVNYPFDQSPVSSNGSNVVLKPDITCSSNSVIIYNDVANGVIYGAYCLLNSAQTSMTFQNNTINSTFSFNNNSVTISSVSNSWGIYGAYISISSYTVALNSSFYLNNNQIIFNSSCFLTNTFAASLSINKEGKNNHTYRPETISMSNNTIQINDLLQPTQYYSDPNIVIGLTQLYLPNPEDYNIKVQNLYVTDNKISISTSNLNMPSASIYLLCFLGPLSPGQ
ncbi:MAG: hypothetical protein LBS29_06475 [Endomicrobium sp.]|jgi:hypothetical protein|nr:hypothetical protein [Endomicrobium sp.]